MNGRASLHTLFSVLKPIVGMVHLLPLPGTPAFGGSFEAVLERALNDARALQAGGADGVLIQNRGDKVFVKDVSPPEIVAAITLATHLVRREVHLPVGVHLLRNDVVGSLAVAALCGAQFIRVGAGVGATYLPQGIIEAQPTRILHERARLRAEGIFLLSDVDSFHYRPLLPNPAESVAQELRDFGLADAAIIAVPDEAELLRKVAATQAANPGLPVWIGGYSSLTNVAEMLAVADGAIVGGAFESGGRNGPVVQEKVARFMEQVNRVRSASAG